MSARGRRRDAGARAAAGHRAGAHVRLGHRQDQRDRPRAAARRAAGSSASALVVPAARWCSSSRSPTCFAKGIGIWGINQPGRLGLRHHQLRLVDRHRPRRHAHLRDPAAAAPGVAHLDQPLRRGDDALRRRVRRAVPAPPPGPAVVRLLALPVPEHDGAVAAVPQPARLGRLRGLDLRHGLAPVLVRRPDPRPRDAARPRATNGLPDRLRHARDGLARLGAPLAALRDRRTCSSPGSRRRSSSRCTRSCRSTSPSSIVPGWHSTIFPPYFVAGAIFSGFAMVLTLAIPLRDGLRPRGLHHRCATWRTWRR